MLEQIYQTYLKSTGVSTDTRKVASGNLFFALKGPSFNGNLFAQAALDNGAIAVVIDEDVPVDNPGKAFRVSNVLDTLQNLARHHRVQLKDTRFIGLTGSNGKTTAKELFRSVLSTTYKTAATQGNLNNHIGVPLTLLSITPDVQIAIVEMGANHRGEIENLSGIALPDIGYITNYGKAHLEGFGGIEGVIEGKSELYARILETGKRSLVNAFDPIQMERSAGTERITFGETGSNYPMTFEKIQHPATVVFEGTEFTSQLTGAFHTANIGAAIALGLSLGVDKENIRKGIHGYVPQNNRSEWRKTERNRVMLDAYNANPSSMAVSIESFISETGSERLLILGDMFELGDEAYAEHQNIVDQLSKHTGTEVWLVGKLFSETRSTSDNFRSFDSTEDCEVYLKGADLSGRSILLKGSRGMHLETLLPHL